jgi:thiol-disulfide isomerase/thioredoxin
VTWCKPCREEIPEFQAFYENFQDEVTILAINITSNEVSVSSVKKFVSELDLNFPVLLDTEDTFMNYQVLNIPTTYFINSAGIIESIHSGAITYEFLENKVKKLD